MTALEGWGFEVARPRLPPTVSADELVEFHRRLSRERGSLGYAVDGVVYKLDDLALQVWWGVYTLLEKAFGASLLPPRIVVETVA